MLQPTGRKLMIDDIRDYLADAKAVTEEWYSREGVEPSHERNLMALATIVGLTWLYEANGREFAEMREMSRIYFVAAFQMGRASVLEYDDNASPAE
jgi:hypothetical protein